MYIVQRDSIAYADGSTTWVGDLTQKLLLRSGLRIYWGVSTARRACTGRESPGTAAARVPQSQALLKNGKSFKIL